MWLRVFNGLGNYFVKKANARKAAHPTTDLLYNALGQKFLHWGDQWKQGNAQFKELWQFTKSGKMTVKDAWIFLSSIGIEVIVWTTIGFGTIRFLYGGVSSMFPKQLPVAETVHDEDH